MPNRYELLGTHHVELFVANAAQAAFYYQKAWGFRLTAFQGLESGCRDHVSYVLTQDRIRLVLTAPLGHGGPINAFVGRHGDGVTDLAFSTDDAEAAFADVTSRGAEPVAKPHRVADEDGEVVLATVKAHGDLQHTFVQASGYKGPYLPGFQKRPVTSPVTTAPVGLKYVDHAVHNVGEGRMNATVQWYQDVFGFHRFWSADDKDIHTEYSSLASIVVANANGRVRMPINEPARGLKKSQIQEYLDYNGGSGVQHLAFATSDIIGTVTALRSNGVEFLTVPDSYYTALTDRIGTIEEPIQALREHGILADRDETGYLLQLFTKPVQDRPTLFYEIIQRKGSDSFGKGNFKALFQAIEREQARRGNL